MVIQLAKAFSAGVGVMNLMLFAYVNALLCVFTNRRSLVPAGCWYALLLARPAYATTAIVGFGLVVPTMA